MKAIVFIFIALVVITVVWIGIKSGYVREDFIGKWEISVDETTFCNEDYPEDLPKLSSCYIIFNRDGSCRYSSIVTRSRNVEFREFNGFWKASGSSIYIEKRNEDHMDEYLLRIEKRKAGIRLISYYVDPDDDIAFVYMPGTIEQGPN